MQRKDFYIEYYNRTDRFFSDEIIWGEKEREKAWRKGQGLISKLGRKIFIVFQYLVLLLCWIPMCFERELWVVIPIAILVFLLQSSITDFSILKIEFLYLIYRKNNVYCSLLHDVFLGSYAEFFNQLTRYTKKKVTGYILIGGGKFYGKFCAVCRNQNERIVLRFQTNCTIVIINKKKFVVKGVLTSKEYLISEIATIINTNQ